MFIAAQSLLLPDSRASDYGLARAIAVSRVVGRPRDGEEDEEDDEDESSSETTDTSSVATTNEEPPPDDPDSPSDASATTDAPPESPTAPDTSTVSTTSEQTPPGTPDTPAIPEAPSDTSQAPSEAPAPSDSSTTQMPTEPLESPDSPLEALTPSDDDADFVPEDTEAAQVSAPAAADGPAPSAPPTPATTQAPDNVSYELDENGEPVTQTIQQQGVVGTRTLSRHSRERGVYTVEVPVYGRVDVEIFKLADDAGISVWVDVGRRGDSQTQARVVGFDAQGNAYIEGDHLHRAAWGVPYKRVTQMRPDGHAAALHAPITGWTDDGEPILGNHGHNLSISVFADGTRASDFAGGYNSNEYHGPSGSAADHPSRTDPNHPNYGRYQAPEQTESATPNEAEEFSTENESATPPLSPGSGFFEQDTVLDGSLGTTEQAEADAQAQQERQPEPAQPVQRDDDDDDNRLAKDDDAQGMEDVGGFGGGGYSGPGLVGQENTTPEMFSHEAEEEPEVAPNTEPDGYNDDDPAGNLGRGFTEEDREAAAGQNFDVDYSDDRDIPSGEDESLNLGRGFTEEDREAAAGQNFDVDYSDNRDIPSGEDESLNLGRGFTKEDREAAAGQDFDVDYSDDRDIPSGEDESLNLGRGFTEEDREAAAGQDFGVDYSDEEQLIHLPGLPGQGEYPPEGYHLTRLNDGSYAYRRDSYPALEAVTDALTSDGEVGAGNRIDVSGLGTVSDGVNTALDAVVKGDGGVGAGNRLFGDHEDDLLMQQKDDPSASNLGQAARPVMPIASHLYMGEGSPNFYIDDSGKLTTTERETAKRWDEFHGTHIAPPIAGGVGDSVNRLLPWEHPLVGNVAGDLAAASTNPLEWIPGEGFVTAYQMQHGIKDLPYHAGQYALGQLPGRQYPPRNYPANPYSPQPGEVVLNDQGIPVAVQNDGAVPRPSYVLDPTERERQTTFEHSVVWPAVGLADAILPAAGGIAIVKGRNAPDAPPAGGLPGSSRNVRAQPGQPRQPVYSHTDPATGEPVFTVGSPPPGQQPPGSSTRGYTYIDQDGNRLYLTDAPPPGRPSTGGDYYPGFLDEGDPRPWGGDAPDSRPPDPSSGGSYRTPGGQNIERYRTPDGQTIYTVEYPDVDASQRPVNVGDGSVLGATSDADASVVVADPEAPTVVEPDVEPEVEEPDVEPFEEPNPDIWFPE